MPQYRYTAIFEPAAEGGYTVTVPVLPGLVTEGGTLDEARAMVEDAIRGYLNGLGKDGWELVSVVAMSPSRDQGLWFKRPLV